MRSPTDDGQTAKGDHEEASQRSSKGTRKRVPCQVHCQMLDHIHSRFTEWKRYVQNLVFFFNQ